ncbi:peptidoglycan DD-metalloendopeptidase family protein [Inhella sp.]|uniref:peptidoglycan DD-metalloendopeptidase family protein n=1 Tax=Inhella sp. TaxID=1921806 RepID=UPI0035B14526
MIATQRFALASRLAAALTLLVLGACSVAPPHRAPVEERTTIPAPPAPLVQPVEAKPAPIAEPARAPSYTVKPGDTLIRIALDQGLGWRELARWNGLDNPNLLEVGQVLRLAPPGAGEAVQSKPVAAARVETKPLETKVEAKTEAKPDARATAPAAAASPIASTSAGAEPDLAWAWPAQGAVQAGFDEQRNKGLAIAGKAGDAVLAAADGRVMYAGSGLRGYGNMVIIKHNDTFLSAYAHNQALLVREDQVVKRGQPIAEMGSSDTDQVKLHFEIRRKGKPVDPARLLPQR